jgi:hypothetical protein
VGFVANRTGSYSQLQTLTIEEFHARQAQHNHRSDLERLITVEPVPAGGLEQLTTMDG